METKRENVDIISGGEVGWLAWPAVCSVGINDELEEVWAGMAGKRELYRIETKENAGEDGTCIRWTNEETENEFVWISCLHIIGFALHLHFTHSILSDGPIPPTVKFHRWVYPVIVAFNAARSDARRGQ